MSDSFRVPPDSPTHQRELCRRRWNKGQGPAEIARALEISRATAHRALKGYRPEPVPERQWSGVPTRMALVARVRRLNRAEGYDD